MAFGDVCGVAVAVNVGLAYFTFALVCRIRPIACFESYAPPVYQTLHIQNFQQYVRCTIMYSIVACSRWLHSRQSGCVRRLRESDESDAGIHSDGDSFHAVRRKGIAAVWRLCSSVRSLPCSYFNATTAKLHAVRQHVNNTF